MAVGRIAGIQAAKKTSDLIPLAHPGLGITGVVVEIEPFVTSNKDIHSVGLTRDYGGIKIKARVDCEGKTGVEMEALTAASVAGLTMYDMLKGIDKGMMLTQTRVIEKMGGKSGGWRWDEEKGAVVKDNTLGKQMAAEKTHGLVRRKRVEERTQTKEEMGRTKGKVDSDDLEEARRKRHDEWEASR